MTDPRTVDELALNHHGRPDDLALSAAGPVYRDSAGRIVTDPQPTPGWVEPPRRRQEGGVDRDTYTGPPPLEAAREWTPIRVLGAPGGAARQAQRSDPVSWRTSSDDGRLPWWTELADAHAIAQHRQAVKDSAAGDPYRRPYTPPSEIEPTYSGSDPSVQVFLDMAADQGYRRGGTR